MLTPEQQNAIRAASEILAKLPGYAGHSIILFTDSFRSVQVASSDCDKFLAPVLRGMLRELEKPPAGLILPGH